MNNRDSAHYFPVPSHPGISPSLATHPIYSFGPGVIPTKPQVNDPPRNAPYDDASQTTVRHHSDRLANPDNSTKNGASDSIKRIGGCGLFALAGSIHFRCFYAME